LEGTLARFLTAVENANSYKADYGHRIVKLETADRLTHARMNSLCQEQNDLEQRLRDGEFDYCSERLTALEEHVGHWFNNDVENRIVALEARVRQCEGYNAYMATLTERLTALETKQDDTEAVIKSRVVSFANAAAQAARPHVGSSARPEPHFCAKCEHTKTWHDATHCYADTVIGRCECDGFEDPCDAFHETRDDQSRVTELEAPAVTAPTVTRERTHGRYGTRNLTKTKPDHIVDANKKVCATCGHAEDKHLITEGDKAQFLLCRAGTLGKPCKCTAFKPVASEG